jgi:hypothetical protein
MKKNYSKFFVGMLALALVFGFMLMGCPDDGGGGDDKLDLPPLGEQATGAASVTVTNAPLTIMDKYGNHSSAADVTGDVWADEFSTKVGTITAGKLNLTLATPSDDKLSPISELGDYYFFGERPGHVLSSSDDTAKYAADHHFNVYTTGNHTTAIYKLARDAGASDFSTFWELEIIYIYVDTDVVLKRAAFTESVVDDGEKWKEQYAAINLQLKAGWNLVQKYDYVSSPNVWDTSYTIANKNVPWVVWP